MLLWGCGVENFSCLTTVDDDDVVVVVAVAVVEGPFIDREAGLSLHCCCGVASSGFELEDSESEVGDLNGGASSWVRGPPK